MGRKGCLGSEKMREKDHKEKRRGEGCLCLGFGEERRGEAFPFLAFSSFESFFFFFILLWASSSTGEFA